MQHLRFTLGAVLIYLIYGDFLYDQTGRTHSLFQQANVKPYRKVAIGLIHIITCFHVAAYVASLNTSPSYARLVPIVNLGRKCVHQLHRSESASFLSVVTGCSQILQRKQK